MEITIREEELELKARKKKLKNAANKGKREAYNLRRKETKAKNKIAREEKKARLDKIKKEEHELKQANKVNVILRKRSKINE